MLKGGDILFARLGPSMENKKSILVDPKVKNCLLLKRISCIETKKRNT